MAKPGKPKTFQKVRRMRTIIRSLIAILGGLRRTVILLLLLASVALNVATVTSSAVFAAVSGAVGAVSGLTTVAAREAGLRAARRDAVRTTTRRVTTRMQRSAARSSASVFAEAIPMVGIGVIAAALALEIRDACDTARDMHVLEGLLADPEADAAALGAAFACSDLIPQVDDLPDGKAILEGMRASPSRAWDASRDWFDTLPHFPTPDLSAYRQWFPDLPDWLRGAPAEMADPAERER